MTVIRKREIEINPVRLHRLQKHIDGEGPPPEGRRIFRVDLPEDFEAEIEVLCEDHLSEGEPRVEARLRKLGEKEPEVEKWSFKIKGRYRFRADDNSYTVSVKPTPRTVGPKTVFKLLKKDETRFWSDDIAEPAGRLFGLYVFDDSVQWHLCSFNASLEMYFAGTQEEERLKDELWDGKNDADLRNSEPVTYMSTSIVEDAEKIDMLQLPDGSAGIAELWTPNEEDLEKSLEEGQWYYDELIEDLCSSVYDQLV